MAATAYPTKPATATPTKPRIKELIPEIQFAQILGKDISTVQRYRNAKRRPLPFYKIGGRYFYDLTQVNRWIEGCAIIRS